MKSGRTNSTYGNTRRLQEGEKQNLMKLGAFVLCAIGVGMVVGALLLWAFTR